METTTASTIDDHTARSPSDPSFLSALIAGGIAGTTVDVALFPIDTIKTRMQAPAGFWRSGGFRGVYNGVGAAAAGSAPGAALFFGTYEFLKPHCLQWQQQWAGRTSNDALQSEGTPAPLNPAWSHMTAATVGEAAACVVRVPTEVVKSKMQTASSKLRLIDTVYQVLQERHGHGWLTSMTGGLYRGYGITLFREIPFAVIQFPLYEQFKLWWSEYQDGQPVHPIQAAACGSLSGGIAAAFTTPLDVLKTRLMLGRDQDGRLYRHVGDVWQRTRRAELWSGLRPRVFWISLGGFVFFGAYEAAKAVVMPISG